MCKKLSFNSNGTLGPNNQKKNQEPYKLLHKDKINLNSSKLRIIDKYSFDNMNGEIIDGKWLEKGN
jgi:hypothetical protein